MKHNKQFLSLFLAFAILFTMLPTAGFAVETEPTEDTAIEEYTDILNEETISEAQMDTAEKKSITDEQTPEQTEETPAPEEVTVQTAEEATVVSEQAMGAVVESGECGDNLTWTLDDQGTLTISGSGEMEDWWDWEDVPWYNRRSSVRSIVIEGSVTSIGGYAFYECGSLTSITIPDSVTSIGYEAFRGCSSLASITIPDSVTSIGGWAFYGCSSLTSITIPDSVTSIGNCAFYGCSSLTNILVDSSNDNYCSHNGILYNKERTRLIVCPPGKVGSITIPSGVTNICDDAFYKCSGLTSITIPNSVTSIGGYVFNHCSGLTSITIPNSVTRICEYTFNHCSSLTSIVIPNSVTSIGEGAFDSCSNLTNVKIPSSVTSIGDVAFGYTWDDEEGEYVVLNGFSISGYTGSAAERYAIDNKIPFTALDKPAKLATPKVSKIENVYGGVKLTWGKVAGAAKYRIFRKSGSGSWAKVADTTALNYTDKTAKSGTKYTYTVRCVSSDGKNYTSDYITTGKSITYIAAPTISKVENVNGGMKVTWGKVTGAAKYRVFYKTGKGSWTKLADTTASTYTWKKAKNGTTYAFTVRCISKDGKAYTSGYDTAGKSLTYVATPTLSSVKNSKAKTMTASWKKLSGVTGFQIQYSTDKSFKSGNKAVTVKKAAAVSQAISGLTKGKTYYVRVRSYKTVSGKNVYSAWSAAKSLKITK